MLNTFVIFLSRVVGSVLDSALGGTRGERHGPGPFYFLIVLVLQLLFGLLASLIVMRFSRQREFHADAGGARLAGTGDMIAALRRLEAAQPKALPGQLAAFGISGADIGGLRRLLMTHPPIAERIEALRTGRYT